MTNTARESSWGYALLSQDGSIVRSRRGYSTRRTAVIYGRRFAATQPAGRYLFHVLGAEGEPVSGPVPVDVPAGRTRTATRMRFPA